MLIRIRDFQAKLGGSQQDRNGWTVWDLELKLWIKALGHFCISGVFSNSHSSQTLPSTHKQSWIHISRIFFKFQLWIGWGGRTARQFQKGCIACEQAYDRGWNWGEWKWFFFTLSQNREPVHRLRMHCFMRKLRNDRKIWILHYCPKDVCPWL